MEYAIQLLIPMLAGLGIGNWLTKTYHVSPLWTVALAILGFALGFGVMAKKALLNSNIPKWDKSKKLSNASPTTQEKGRVVEKSTGIMPHEMDFLYQDYSHEADDTSYDFSDRHDDINEKHS
jgi:hypothetical protein